MIGELFTNGFHDQKSKFTDEYTENHYSFDGSTSKKYVIYESNSLGYFVSERATLILNMKQHEEERIII